MKAFLIFAVVSALLAIGAVQESRRDAVDDTLSTGGAQDADVTSAIQTAIKSRCLLAIVFDGDGAERIVEPHMLALNERDEAALSAWWLRGSSTSSGKPGWREYLLSRITAARVMAETFDGPRLGYDPTGGRKFHTVISRL